MFYLVNSDQILLTAERPHPFSDDWDKQIGAVWVESPIHRDVAKVEAGLIVVDPDKQAAKDAQEAGRQARLATIRGARGAINLPQLTNVVVAMAEEFGFTIDP